LKQVDDSIYCFWDNGDDDTHWIEHVVYYPDTNEFEYYGDKKIEFTNDSTPITGFDFGYVELPVTSSSSSSST
jgi:hypothetical protein